MAKTLEPRPLPKRPTQKTIAEMTGLAVTTVSRALAGDPIIAEKTRRLVAETARNIGYVPDRAAQRLRTGRTNVISMILSPHDEMLGFTNSMTMGVSRALKGTPYNLVIVPSFEERTELATIRKIVHHSMADGLIFSRTEPYDERIRFLLETGFPFVCHGRTHFPAPHLFVDFDNESFARMAVEQLVARGRRHLYAVLPDPKFTFHGHLRQGFVSAAGAAGVRFEIAEEVNLDCSGDVLYEAMSRRLQQPEPPDGFVCAGETVAMATMACLADLGLSIGTDADLVAKQTSRVFGNLRPKIDTIFEDIAEAGCIMGQMLLKGLREPDGAREGFIQAPVKVFGD